MSNPGRTLLTPEATSVPTLWRGYQKGGSCHMRLVRPNRPNTARGRGYQKGGSCHMRVRVPV